METVLTVDVVAKRLRRTFSQVDEEAVAEILVGVQGELESALGRYLTVRTVTDETWTLRPSQDRVFFRGSPVLSVSSFAIDNVVQNPINYAAYPWGVQIFGVFSQFLAPPVAKYTYVAGYDGADDAKYPGIRSLLLRASIRESMKMLADVDGLASFRSEGFFATFEDLFAEAELKRLSRYKRRKAFGSLSGTTAGSYAGPPSS